MRWLLPDAAAAPVMTALSSRPEHIQDHSALFFRLAETVTSLLQPVTAPETWGVPAVYARHTDILPETRGQTSRMSIIRGQPGQRRRHAKFADR